MLNPNIITLNNKKGMQISLMDWGATWLSCQLLVQGNYREVLLGCPPEQYDQQSAYLGASIGRYANRIAHSQFYWQGQLIQLEANQGEHQLHGGPIGFDKRYWQIEKCGQNFAKFSLFSPNGDQGFRGNVQASVVYHLSPQNYLEIEYSAYSDQDTPLNLTNHAYFNLLNGQQNQDIRQHYLQINADYYLPVDQQGIPSAPLTSVSDTSFDFRQMKTIAQDFLQGEQQLTKGYDQAFLLNQRHIESQPAASLVAPDKSLQLDLYTSQPALQVYTGNYLAGTAQRQSGYYQDYAGIALETQALPDTPNHQDWQPLGGMLKAGEIYRHWTRFVFVVG
ncbi:aldose 1-epimerase [Volucribacter psittacicida]|uniref:Aldose 1-epimerase n=1 Tax=Volucribacter psittacicida TaxID=203482 RepID=A0A4V2PBQ3_9PAST|nr:galactose-1-epimerase [Volucribacter psittacicida]TCJ98325.1 aldose 1-epimerase [Volucribacter psittacicida]